MLVERESDLPLKHRLHQQPHDREHSQRRHPCGFLQPHWADGDGMLNPAKARFHRDMLFLIRLENLRGYPETLSPCRSAIKQHSCGNKTQDDHKERACSV